LLSTTQSQVQLVMCSRASLVIEAEAEEGEAEVAETGVAGVTGKCKV